MIRDYRSQQVKGLTEEHTAQVLIRLAGAAVRTGRMPHQDPLPPTCTSRCSTNSTNSAAPATSPAWSG